MAGKTFKKRLNTLIDGHPNSVANNRQRQVLTQLYQRHWLELCAYINKKFGAGPPDPEDVSQTAFEKLAARDDLPTMQNPRAFLYRVAQNIVIDHHRQQATRNKHAQALETSQSQNFLDDSGPEHVLMAREGLTIIQSVLNKLPFEQRQLVVLNRIHNLSYAEIARRTGMSQTEIKRQVAYALVECDEALERAEQALKNAR